MSQQSESMAVPLARLSSLIMSLLPPTAAAAANALNVGDLSFELGVHHFARAVADRASARRAHQLFSVDARTFAARDAESVATVRAPLQPHAREQPRRDEGRADAALGLAP